MLSESSDVKFAIGQVLFIDIVGYLKLLINEQSQHIPLHGDPRFEELADKIITARSFAPKRTSK